MFSRRLLRLVPPSGEAARIGAIEEQRVPEQGFDRLLDFRAEGFDNRAQPRALTRLALKRFEVVADRLFTRDRRQRAKYRREESDGAAALRRDAHVIGAGVDIDETAVDFPAGRTVAQHAYRLGEGPVYQHGAIDQRHAGKVAALPVAWHDPLKKTVAPGPVLAALRNQFVDLFDEQGGEGTGKTGG